MMEKKRRKITANDEKLPAMTTYIPEKLKKAEQAICNKLGVSLSSRIRNLMEKDIAEHSGIDLQPEFDYNEKKSQHIKLRKAEDTLYNRLTSEVLPTNHRPAYETLVSFAVSLGTDDGLTRNIEDVLKQLHFYDIQPSDPFFASTLETFIQYLEVVLERRGVEAELKTHRRKRKGVLGGD
jgi:antitoxin component of RelBE/YafQ-DinJ toxin-antitoxin module